jgi:hypothetical protein
VSTKEYMEVHVSVVNHVILCVLDVTHAGWSGIRQCGSAWHGMDLSETFMVRLKFKSQLFAGVSRICSSTYIQKTVIE